MKLRNRGSISVQVSLSRGTDPRGSAAIPVYIAGRERMYEGMRPAGIPEQ